MVETLAIVFYLLPFVALGLTLLFLALASYMARVPPLSDPRAEDESSISEGGAATPDDEFCVIRVTRQHDQFSHG